MIIFNKYGFFIDFNHRKHLKEMFTFRSYNPAVQTEQ